MVIRSPVWAHWRRMDGGVGWNCGKIYRFRYCFGGQKVFPHSCSLCLDHNDFTLILKNNLCFFPLLTILRAPCDRRKGTLWRNVSYAIQVSPILPTIHLTIRNLNSQKSGRQVYWSNEPFISIVKNYKQRPLDCVLTSVTDEHINIIPVLGSCTNFELLTDMAKTLASRWTQTNHSILSKHARHSTPLMKLAQPFRKLSR